MGSRRPGTQLLSTSPEPKPQAVGLARVVIALPRAQHLHRGRSDLSTLSHVERAMVPFLVSASKSGVRHTQKNQTCIVWHWPAAVSLCALGATLQER